MGKWLQSGLRRDVVVVVDARDRPTAQAIKRAVEARYDERIPPRRFHGALDALVDTGHLNTAVDGVHDRYWLTEAGRRRFEEHREWLCDAR
ncbi:MAG: PadR family transcriptional regulator [Halanaeroarchaeum sp.]